MNTLFTYLAIFVAEKVNCMAVINVKLVDKSDKATLYTICFEGEDISEFEKFLMKFKDNAELRRDYQIILLAVKKILDNGVFERYFRPEGKVKDNVCALPITSGKLRLYCLRLSDKILIAGNGGIKQNKTYNESEELSGYVMDLQKFDNILRIAIKKGSVTVEETEILDIESKTFEL